MLDLRSWNCKPEWQVEIQIWRIRIQNVETTEVNLQGGIHSVLFDQQEY